VAPYVTLNALRRYLRDRGCIEERVLRDAASGRAHIEFRCSMKNGRQCRAVATFDRMDTRVPANMLEILRRTLAPCLGRSWVGRIPDEDPFG
jgi:hypothetical protein